MTNTPTTAIRVGEIWRYPVKSMAGEPLSAAELGELGIPGDRELHVEDQRGNVVTARSRPLLLRHRAAIAPDGELWIDGRPWSAPDVAADVEAAAGAGARLVEYAGAERFDVLPLLVATDGAIEAFGYDRRRLRPNILLQGVSGLAERHWPGRELRVGQVVIGVVSLRQRCVMTTYDPDTNERDLAVLHKIRHDFAGKLALDCEVLRPGRIAVGDLVRLA